MTSSTSAQSTRTRSETPSTRTARNRASVRFARRSTNVNCISGRMTAMTRPGTPAPLPRSMQDVVDWGRASANAAAWVMISARGALPRAPIRWASPNTCSKPGCVAGLLIGPMGQNQSSDSLSLPATATTTRRCGSWPCERVSTPATSTRES